MTKTNAYRASALVRVPIASLGIASFLLTQACSFDTGDRDSASAEETSSTEALRLPIRTLR